MTDDDRLRKKLEEASRSVARLSKATKVVCVVMLFVAAGFFFYALSRLDHDGDFAGFSTIALGITAFALVLWSTAAFHAAYGVSLEVLYMAHKNVEVVRQATSWMAGQSTAAAARPPAPSPSPPGSEPAEPAEEAAEAAAPEAASPRPKKKATNGSTAEAKPAPEPPPKPTTKSCPHCRGTIKIDATRCRHCFEVA